MSRKEKEEFWTQFENFIGEKVPPCIVAICKHYGYSTKIALMDMNANEIAEIEQFVNGDTKDFLQVLQCCNADYYKNQQIFKFLPGHVRFLIKIPSVIEQMQSNLNSENRKVSQRNRKQPKRLQSTTLAALLPTQSNGVCGRLESNDNSNNSSDNNNEQPNSTTTRNTESHENNEDTSYSDSSTNNNHPFDSISVDTMNELYDNLCNKFSIIAKDEKLGFLSRINHGSITPLHYDFTENQGITIKCHVKCPLCSKNYTVLYIKFWQVGNIVKHFKKCAVNNNYNPIIDFEDDMESHQSSISGKVARAIGTLSSPM